MSGSTKVSWVTVVLFAGLNLSLILNGYLVYLIFDQSVTVTHCHDSQPAAWDHQDKLDQALKNCGANRECMGPTDPTLSVTFGPGGKYLGSSDGSHETPGYVRE